MTARQVYAQQIGTTCLGITGTSGNWRCDAGPPLAAAAAQAASPDSTGGVPAYAIRRLHDLAVAHQGEAGQGVDGILFSAHLAHGLILADSTRNLTPERRAVWVAHLTAACDFLISNRDVSWYANGNIRLALMVAFALTAKITGRDDYQQQYEASWGFTLNPPLPQWAGMGLRMQTPSAGYLTENGGFDPEYTMMQASQAARLYVLTGDERALWLTGVLFGALEPRIDFDTMILDASHGSRHPEPVRVPPATTGALPVLAATSRPDLAVHVDGWWRQVLRLNIFPNGTNPGAWYAMGMDLAAGLAVCK